MPTALRRARSPLRTPAHDLSSSRRVAPAPGELGELAAPELPSLARLGTPAASSVHPEELGGRRAASSSFLVAAGGAELEAVATELGEVRTELRQVLDAIAAAQVTLHGAVRAVNEGVADAARERDRLAGLERDLKRSRSKRKKIGGAATVLGFLVGGPVGALLGNGAGFATLADLSKMDGKIRHARGDVAHATTRLTQLEARRDRIVADKAALAARASKLEDRDAALAERLRTAPADHLRTLTSARRDARSMLGEAKVLLLDHGKLVVRASELGVDVTALRDELRQKVAHLEAYVAEVDRALEAAMFDLALAVVGAANGLRVLSATDARVLRTALGLARNLDEPLPRRVARLAGALVGTVLPEDAARAERLATALIGVLSEPRDTTLLEIAGRAALSEAQRALLDELTTISDSEPNLAASLPLIPLARAMLVLSPAEQEAAATLFRALARVSAAPADAPIG